MNDFTDQFDRLVAEAFPGDPLAKYHSRVTLDTNGDIHITHKGETRTIYEASPTLPHPTPPHTEEPISSNHGNGRALPQNGRS
jgi:hypothetical protein